MADTPPPADWLELLACSQAQIEAGRAVPMEPILDRLRDSIRRMESRATTPAGRTGQRA